MIFHITMLVSIIWAWFVGGVDPVQNVGFQLLWGVLAVFGLWSARLGRKVARVDAGYILAVAEYLGMAYVLNQGGFSLAEIWPTYLMIGGVALRMIVEIRSHGNPNPSSAQEPTEIDRTSANPKGNINNEPNPIQQPKPESLFPAEKSLVTFSDVVGMDEFKDKLFKASVEVLESAKAARHGQSKEVRNGILLYGKPGNGKTYFAEALAGELDLPIVRLAVGNSASRWVNETTERVTAAFQSAIAQAPCVLFIDEIDSFLVRRDKVANADSETSRTVNTMLTEFVRLREHRILLIAATNFLDQLDEAAIREGRFDYKVEVPPPDLKARLSVLRHIFKRNNTQIRECSNLEAMVRRWDGFSVAKVRAIASQIMAELDQQNTRDLKREHVLAAIRSVQGRMGQPIPVAIPTVDQLEMDESLKVKLSGLARRMAQVDLIEELGGSVPRGVLFHGRPGTGKTYAVQSLAKTAGWAFLTVTGPELTAEPGKIAELMDRAADIRPCLVFVDEAEDALADRRESYVAPATARFLAAMDGVSNRASDVMVVAATNFPDRIDSALLRGGRFSEALEFLPPSNGVVKQLVERWYTSLTVTVKDELKPAHVFEVVNGKSIADIKAMLKQIVNSAIDRAPNALAPHIDLSDLSRSVYVNETVSN